MKYLQALEAGELDKIPQVYIKFFFQSYLSYFKYEDQADLLSEFLKLTETPVSVAEKVHSSEKDTSTNRKNFLIYVPLGVFVLIIIILIWQSTGVDVQNVKIEELPITAAVEELVGKQDVRLDSTVQSDTLTNSKLAVKIEALSRTWLRSVKDNKDTTEYMLDTGNQVNMEADSLLTFTIGNAGGLKFSINGKDAGVPGQNGEVISAMKITSKGIVEKKIRKSVKKETVLDSTQHN